MKKLLPFILVAIASVLLSVTVSYFLLKKETKTGFIQLGKVYNDFELSKKLNTEFTATATNRKNFLDSLEFQVKNIYQQASTSKDQQLVERFERAQRQYQYQKEQIENTIGKLEEQYNEQIWKQLNEYVKEYGKEKKYDYIFGAEGSGTIMYSAETKDLTEEVLKYVNNKYQGN